MKILIDAQVWHGGCWCWPGGYSCSSIGAPCSDEIRCGMCSEPIRYWDEDSTWKAQDKGDRPDFCTADCSTVHGPPHVCSIWCSYCQDGAK